jgi:hypothetical protein
MGTRAVYNYTRSNTYTCACVAYQHMGGMHLADPMGEKSRAGSIDTPSQKFVI